MMQAWTALFGAAFTVAGCYAAGWLMLRWSRVRLAAIEMFPLGLVTGASCVHLVVFGALAVGIGYKAVWVVVLGGVIVGAGVVGRVASWPGMAPPHNCVRNAQDSRCRDSSSKENGGKEGGGSGWDWGLVALGGGIFAAFSVLYFVNAWAPETSPDGAGYHLEIVGRFARAHGFRPMTTEMYAGLSEGVEMLYQPAFAFGKHSAAALVHFSFLIALAMGIFGFGLRMGKAWVGAAAALLVYASPVVGRDGTTAYIDVAVGAIVFAVFYWLEIWDEQREARLLVIIGLVAGYAYAAKYTAFVMLPYALVFVAWKTRRVRPVLVICGWAALMIAPWIIKDWIYWHNPVAPLANELFPNPYLHPLPQQMWAEWLRRYDVANLWTLPYEVAVNGGKTQGIIGPVFLLVPLGFIALRYREGRRLLAAGCVVLVPYFGNVGTRFLIPCLPFFALALALALTQRFLLMGVVAFHAVASWPSELLLYSNPYLWRIEHFPYKAALRIMPQEDYLRRNLGDYDVAKLVEEKVPAGERVFALTGFAESYTSRDIVLADANRTLGDFLNIGYLEDYQPTRGFEFHFPERTMRRVRLVQTAQGTGQEQWNVGELRFFDGGVEVPRSGAWTLRAWPNPWEVQLAFDNSPATRWRSWQTGTPGMYIDVDFGRDQKVDEVRMETSHDYTWAIKLRVESYAAGRWAAVTDQFEEKKIKPRGSLRRAAMYEFQARGYHYVLVQDRDWGASDFADDPESWGLEVAGRSAGATLYRVIP